MWKGKKIIGFIMASMIAMTATPNLSHPIVSYAASNQTTIIMIDNLKSTYQKGEHFTATIRVSSPDGSYLQKAWCGFGYNASTMTKISETDTNDHIWLTSETPSKWLEGSIEFEMKADGKAYFIAGAYSGDGVIEAYKADGSRISCPRASVVYKIGTGIYTATSDCNLKEFEMKDAETNMSISFNRAFDKNITEYWAEVSSSCKEVTISAVPEQSDDTVVLPESLVLNDGENELHVGVQAVSGEIKNYVFHVTKPKESAEITSIQIQDGNGNEIPFNFDPETYSYDISVEENVTDIEFMAEAGNSVTQIEYPATKALPQGYSFKYIYARTSSEEKKYEFYIYRKLSSLSLSSLVIETSDGATYPFNEPFSPDKTVYNMQVPSDVRKAYVYYTVANSGDYVTEPVEEVKLVAGDNPISVTVSNGLSEKTYTVHVFRDEGEVFTVPAEEETEPFRNTKEHVGFEYKDLLPLSIVGGIGLAAAAIGFTVATCKAGKTYNESPEAAAVREEAERKKRMKQIEKEKEKEKKKK